MINEPDPAPLVEQPKGCDESQRRNTDEPPKNDVGGRGPVDCQFRFAPRNGHRHQPVIALCHCRHLVSIHAHPPRGIRSQSQHEIAGMRHIGLEADVPRCCFFRVLSPGCVTRMLVRQPIRGHVRVPLSEPHFRIRDQAGKRKAGGNQRIVRRWRRVFVGSGETHPRPGVSQYSAHRIVLVTALEQGDIGESRCCQKHRAAPRRHQRPPVPVPGPDCGRKENSHRRFHHHQPPPRKLQKPHLGECLP